MIAKIFECFSRCNVFLVEYWSFFLNFSKKCTGFRDRDTQGPLFTADVTHVLSWYAMIDVIENIRKEMFNSSCTSKSVASTRFNKQTCKISQDIQHISLINFSVTVLFSHNLPLLKNVWVYSRKFMYTRKIWMHYFRINPILISFWVKMLLFAIWFWRISPTLFLKNVVHLYFVILQVLIQSYPHHQRSRV